MTIWILTILLLGLLGLVGFYQQSVRAALSLVGVIAGLFLAVPLGKPVEGLLTKVGLENPVYTWMLAPLIVFLVVVIIANIIGQVIHRKVDLLYKYQREDYERHLWERMSKRLGLLLGMISGGILLVTITSLAHPAGYLTYQTSPSDSPHWTVSFLNSLRKDMSETGFDKLTARFDPAPEKFYETADVLGLLYHNPLLYGRLPNYPELIKISESESVQQLGSDTEFLSMLQSQPDLVQILNDPRAIALLTNSELTQELADVNLRDLETFLKTGESPAYKDIKILGRWEMDVYSLMTTLLRQKPDISSHELIQFRKIAAPILEGLKFAATPDGTAMLKFEPTQSLKDLLSDIQKQFNEQQEAAQQATQQQSQSPATAGGGRAGDVMQRYGLSGGLAAEQSQSSQPSAQGQQQAEQPSIPNIPAPEIPAAPSEFSSPSDIQKSWVRYGSWEKDFGEKYTIRLPNEQRKEEEYEGVIRDYNLILTHPTGQTMVFEKVY